jgi:hypothetical protein
VQWTGISYIIVVPNGEHLERVLEGFGAAEGSDKDELMLFIHIIVLFQLKQHYHHSVVSIETTLLYVKGAFIRCKLIINNYNILKIYGPELLRRGQRGAFGTRARGLWTKCIIMVMRFVNDGYIRC